MSSSRAELYTLDFDITPTPGQGAPISQQYGDTDLVDVGHRRVDVFGEDAVIVQGGENLQWYNTGFGTLEKVAWGGDDRSHVGEFSFTATAPQGYVTLHWFDLAAYKNIFAVYSEIHLYAVSEDDTWGDPVWSSGEILIPRFDETAEGGYVRVFVDEGISARELRLQWSDPQFVAIDNIHFSAVPEPASVVAWLMGGACLGFWGYRRRRPARAA